MFREKTETTDRQKNALTILLASVGVTAFIIGITSAEAAHYYFFMAWFVAAVLVAVMVDHMPGETAGICRADLNGGSIVCHTESEIHLL